jgi:sulfofructose kinase
VEHVDLVGVGLNATDTLISVSHLPGPGLKADVRSISVLPGGQVATAVVACQRWGLRTRYVGKLGDDGAGGVHVQAFADAGIETRITTVPGCASAQSFILVDDQGERTVLWHRDPKLAIAPEDLQREWIINARALLLDGCDTAAAAQAAQWARSAGIPVIADVDAAYSGIESLLQNVDYLVVSRDFPERISGKRDLKASLPWLQQQFKSRLAAATLGTEGVLGWDGEQFHYSLAYEVAAVDTTGAGDIFHAAFVCGLLQGWPMQRMLDFACAAAALNCTGAGARGRIGTLGEIETLMRSGKRYAAVHESGQ